MSNEKLRPEDIIGLTEEEASKEIVSAGLRCNIKKRDATSFPAATGYRNDRLNLVVRDGLVVSATIG